MNKKRLISYLILSVAAVSFVALAIASQGYAQDRQPQSIGRKSEINVTKERRTEVPKAEMFRGRAGERGQGPKHERIERFLEFMRRYHQTTRDPYEAVGLAALGIKEIHKQQGQPLLAAKKLEESLDKTSDQKMRNILLFHLRQIYEEQRDLEQLLRLNEQILDENLQRKTAQ